MTAHMWRREMTNKYYIFEDEDGDVHISLKKEDNYLKAFMSLWIHEDEDMPSIFKSSEDAKLFAEIIVKLLEQIT